MPLYKLNKKKDGLQCYKVVISFTQNGEHLQTSRTVYGLAEARAAEAELLAQVKNPQSSRMTVSDLLQRYLLALKPDVKENTLRTYEAKFRMFVYPFIGSERLDRLNIQKLEQWKAQIMETDYSPATKRSAFRAFSAVLNYAVRAEILESNPLKKLKAPKVSSLDSELHYYTAEQFQQYISVALDQAQSSGDFRFFVFACVAFYTGMRKGEINALKWSDITDNIIHVRRSIEQHINGKDIEGTPKTESSIRDIQIPAPLMQVLQEHRRRQEQSPAFSEEFRVCGGQNIINDNTIAKRHQKIIQLAGLPSITIHDFRHSHASLLINEGISIQEIARRLGHKDVQTTWQIYAHLYPREEERAVSILNRVKINQE